MNKLFMKNVEVWRSGENFQVEPWIVKTEFGLLKAWHVRLIDVVIDRAVLRGKVVNIITDGKIMTDCEMNTGAIDVSGTESMSFSPERVEWRKTVQSNLVVHGCDVVLMFGNGSVRISGAATHIDSSHRQMDIFEETPQ